MIAAGEKSLPELAVRHVDLVYASALRQVRDPQMALDVTQAVFLVLLRKQSRLNAHTILPVWLLRVTRYACLDAAKQARRRSHHERKAATMPAHVQPPEEPAGAAPGESAALWTAIDEALDRLPEADRTAIVLAYLEGLSHKGLAQRLGISEAAAHKRVQRAIAKLRQLLSRRGLSLPAGTAAATLATLMHPSAAPAAVIHAVAAVSHGKVSALVQALAGKTLLLIRMTQMKMLTLALAIVCAGTVATEMAVTAAGRTPPAAKSTAASATSRAASPFGPTVELVLHDGDLADLGKGKVLPPPALARDANLVESFFASLSRGDLFYDNEGAGGTLDGTDMMAVPMPSSNFDLDFMPINNVKVLLFTTPSRPALLSTEGRLPRSFVIKTRDGNVGFLQIVKVEGGAVPSTTAPAGAGLGKSTGIRTTSQVRVTIRYRFLLPQMRDDTLLQVAVGEVFGKGQMGLVPSIRDEMKKAAKAARENRPDDASAAVRVIALGMECLDPLMHGTKWGKEVHEAAQLAQQMADNSGHADDAQQQQQMARQGVALDSTLNDLVKAFNSRATGR